MDTFVSLWSADLLALGADVDRIDDLVTGYHIDVFDGHNVPDLLFGPDLVGALRRRTRALIDVHLNVTDPEYWAKRFLDAGADIIDVQHSACADPRATLGLIAEGGGRPGLGLEVHQPIEVAADLFDACDRVLVMGTPIGVKGCDLEATTPNRLEALAARRGEDGPSLVVDGGIRSHTVPLLAAAGADGVVPGSLVFNSDDPRRTLGELSALVPGPAR